MNEKRVKGDRGEEYTCRWLKRRFYKVLGTNYSCRFGEIDIIARKGKFICFIEVKTRSRSGLASPAAAVDTYKQHRILTTAQHYLCTYPSDLQPRFDVAEVTMDDGKIKNFNYIQNAFGE